MKATDTLIATTKAIGVLRLPNGQQLATDYLQTLGDARAAYSTAQVAALHATIANKTVLAKAVDAADGKLLTALISIGNPLSALNADATLAAAVQGDAGSATVMDFYRPATTSGLSVGDCTNDTEQPVSCSQPHWGEVTLVTSYPADSTAPWPGNDVMSAFTNQTCDAAFGTYVGVPLEQSEYNAGWFSPNPGTDWNGGDREVVCTVISGDTNGSITGSLKGSTT